MIHFDCPSFSGNPRVGPLVFDWDEVAGTVSGPGAADIMAWVRQGNVPLHPQPCTHFLSDAPLKSRADMAAIVGYLHRLPPELADAYPAVGQSPEWVETLDADGQVIERVNVLY